MRVSLLLVMVSLGFAPPAFCMCTTLLWRELLHVAVDGVVGERPDDAAVIVDSINLPLRVHVRDGIDGGRGAVALAILEREYDKQVQQLGYDPPLQDDDRGGDPRFDVYLTAMPTGVGARTIAEADASPDDGKRASPSYIEVDAALNDDDLDVYLSHEFMHALQFAVDVKENIGLLEMSAVYAEAKARPDLLAWHEAVPAFQGAPQFPIYADSLGITAVEPLDDPRFEYGAVLLAFFLEDTFGDGSGAVLRDLLWAARSPDDDDELPPGGDRNEPDWLDGFASVTGAEVATALTQFSVWRVRIGELSDTDEGPFALALPQNLAPSAGVVVPEALDGDTFVTNEAQGPYNNGCVLRRINAAANDIALEVDVNAPSSDMALAITAVVGAANSGITRAAQATGTGAAALAIDVAARESVVVSMCVTQPFDADAALVHVPLRIALTDANRLVPSEADDTSASTDDEPPDANAPSNCHCALTSPADSAALVVLSLVLTRLRQKRRQPRI